MRKSIEESLAEFLKHLNSVLYFAKLFSLNKVNRSFKSNFILTKHYIGLCHAVHGVAEAAQSGSVSIIEPVTTNHILTV